MNQPVVTLFDNKVTEIYHSPIDYRPSNVFFCLDSIIRSNVYMKYEAGNFAGSIKIKPALRMIEALEKENKINRDTVIVESSSGNLGIALSLIAASKGYKFLCVTDAMASQQSINLMKSYGAEVVVITERDENGGYLKKRLEYINHYLQNNRNCIWLNQYANPNNYLAHYYSTAKELLDSFYHIDYLFVGAGTTGTLMGCINYFEEFSPKTTIVAVDNKGSVTFGLAPDKRNIPGLGTSRAPEILQADKVSNLEVVSDQETIAMCREMVKRGYLVGGSTGTVLAAIKRWNDVIEPHETVVMIAPDSGEKYIDTIYNDEWCQHIAG
ncbi:2,3-diaminopropionate biosynthesis protein SbnA [Zooshikella ganghwensis]|uniref:cysteine synthase n=1 Tax=Zooshikella ganghwensis TaxID=202772 RepID=A0A4P9VUW9_9GAMM|nr:2,3-diaminopropionate biosynthesis protein SbnA [Zooshikella ganghwensis]RDH46234.1 2,3-diaminopropionate biosynthesis protein SbnA [Zooshikella ganghwensis]